MNEPAAGPAGPPDPRDAALCDELLSYLREHPRAMDTLEGIAEWWIPRQRIRTGVERILRALETLTASGAVEQVSRGGRRLYRLRRGNGLAAGAANHP